ncbi:MAG: glycosyltransferase family 2 protein [Verrucomicrobiales bacterium]|nr:glycosyltransferase family 2 protein [Verrucomicrobiales bacterium]
MKFSILINNYNYGAYVCETVNSALAQTSPPHEIIVVDDGSTDDSLALLRECYADNQLVKIIAQKNTGQFAAIAAGIDAATGDIACLLDADDRYRPDYLASLLMLYREKPWIDLVFCRFTAVGGEMKNPVWLSPPGDYDYGRTALLAYFHSHAYSHCWIGNVTSCLSLTLTLARKLELRALGEGGGARVHADYALLLGASLLGARKYHLSRELVEYRLHGGNRWASQGGVTNEERLVHCLTLNYHARHLGARLLDLLPEELATVPTPLAAHRACYRKLCRRFRCKNGALVENRLRRWRHGIMEWLGLRRR